MTARILVVDDLLPNVKLLEARLSAEYFDVTTASSGREALMRCGADNFDMILLDVMMPGMDGFETCRLLKADSTTAHIPVVMVTALDQPADRVKGLEAGADDFLTKPVDEMALLARVRSLTRLKMVVDELRGRAGTAAMMGVTDGLIPAPSDETGLGGRIMLVDDRPHSAEHLANTLTKTHGLAIEPDPQAALIKGADANLDLFIISLGLRDYDALRLCGQIRSLERTRNIPILLIADLEDRARVLRGLDIGINDYLTRPLDRNELLARVRTQIRRKRYSDRLRDTLQASIEMAIIDALTGLNNRRFLESQLKTLLSAATSRNKPLSVMILDIDHFKSINDTYGHDVGDEVLKAFAGRIRSVTRGTDLVCRLGGEEFIVVLPETGINVAEAVAERLRTIISRAAFPILDGRQAIPVTVSIGIADRGYDVEAAAILKRADLALYRSKLGGRNMVSAEAA